ncbi:hypothetical protein SteCoe_31255 [Stentor coeruleus]|uniref:Uncharacterized protein n=1 Tax=Stentor coeruleus TaxID=5963 RepID=A0A1R2B1X8_9CILI|nr:hypothetical protein SteCoe_31255 [Stentor coeruleus]
MGCGLGKQNLKAATPISLNKEDRQKIAKSKDEDSKEVKRQKMLEAAEAREKQQKMHGMNEKSYKEYEEKVKRQQSAPNNNKYEPLDWNS